MACSDCYASKGILPLLLAFMAPHGMLELSAICIAAEAIGTRRSAREDHKTQGAEREPDV